MPDLASSLAMNLQELPRQHLMGLLQHAIVSKGENKEIRDGFMSEVDPVLRLETANGQYYTFKPIREEHLLEPKVNVVARNSGEIHFGPDRNRAGGLLPAEPGNAFFDFLAKDEEMLTILDNARESYPKFKAKLTMSRWHLHYNDLGQHPSKDVFSEVHAAVKAADPDLLLHVAKNHGYELSDGAAAVLASFADHGYLSSPALATILHRGNAAALEAMIRDMDFSRREAQTIMHLHVPLSMEKDNLIEKHDGVMLKRDVIPEAWLTHDTREEINPWATVTEVDGDRLEVLRVGPASDIFARDPNLRDQYVTTINRSDVEDHEKEIVGKIAETCVDLVKFPLPAHMGPSDYALVPQGTTVQIWMGSRFGDFGVADLEKANGYFARVNSSQLDNVRTRGRSREQGVAAGR